MRDGLRARPHVVYGEEPGIPDLGLQDPQAGKIGHWTLCPVVCGLINRKASYRRSKKLVRVLKALFECPAAYLSAPSCESTSRMVRSVLMKLERHEDDQGTHSSSRYWGRFPVRQHDICKMEQRIVRAVHLPGMNRGLHTPESGGSGLSGAAGPCAAVRQFTTAATARMESRRLQPALARFPRIRRPSRDLFADFGNMLARAIHLDFEAGSAHGADKGKSARCFPKNTKTGSPKQLATANAAIFGKRCSTAKEAHKKKRLPKVDVFTSF